MEKPPSVGGTAEAKAPQQRDQYHVIVADAVPDLSELETLIVQVVFVLRSNAWLFNVPFCVDPSAKGFITVCKTPLTVIVDIGKHATGRVADHVKFVVKSVKNNFILP